MGQPVAFPGVNRRFVAPAGEEERVGTLEVFTNGACIVSAWELTDAELAEIVRTRRVFLSVWSGDELYPVFVGAESVTRSVVVDFGAVWPRESESEAA